MNYVPMQSSIKVENPEDDVKIVYYPFEQVERLNEDASAETNISIRESEPEEDNSNSNILFIPINHNVGKAIVNFIDLENNACPIATSDVLVGDAGTKINDIYSTANEIEKLKKQGYQVIYNGFDGNKAAQYFEYNQNRIKVYTVAMKRVKTAKYDKSLTLKNAGIEPVKDKKGGAAESEKEDTKREKPTIILPTLDQSFLEQDQKDIESNEPKKNKLKSFFHWGKK